MSKSEFDYELEAKEYLTHLSPHTQKLAMKAIEDCFTLGRDWRWIATALNKKSYSNYERWHFGLFFSKNFDLSVKETMRREDEAESNDLDTFFSVLEDSYSFDFPSPLDTSTQEQEITSILRKEGSNE